MFNSRQADIHANPRFTVARHPKLRCMVGRYTFEDLRQLKAITAVLARLLACLRACLRRALACRGWGLLLAVGMTDSGQFRPEMEVSWDLVYRKFDAPQIFGDRAAAALCAMSARAAHHDLPLAPSLTAGTVALANGATVSVFPGTCRPLMLCVVNTNYPQTQKSSSFGMLTKLAHKLDQGVLIRETAFLQEFGSDDAGVEAPLPVCISVVSSTWMRGTSYCVSLA